MKPATSLCSLRIVAGTRRCTNVSPRTAARQAPQTTTMPYITVIGGGLFPPFAYQIVGGSQDTSRRVYKQIGSLRKAGGGPNPLLSRKSDFRECGLGELPRTPLLLARL